MLTKRRLRLLIRIIILSLLGKVRMRLRLVSNHLAVDGDADGTGGEIIPILDSPPLKTNPPKHPFA